ncbi:hypothetical protein BD770DRAFT_407433 [Pilaira anomala]|nr:hypothetical protein BD770DRAFT_407433 [Pilaira anomala]
MAGGVAMTGVAMTGVAMTDAALNNTGVALVVAVMMQKDKTEVIMVVPTLSSTHFRNISICSLLALESKRTKRSLKESWIDGFILVVISKKNIIIDCCVVVLIRCILIFETSASGPPRGLSWETLNPEAKALNKPNNKSMIVKTPNTESMIARTPNTESMIAKTPNKVNQILEPNIIKTPSH